MRCTYEDCEQMAEHHDPHHAEVQLCYAHAAMFYWAFSEWLWHGTPDHLERWLRVFRHCGGLLK